MPPECSVTGLTISVLPPSDLPFLSLQVTPPWFGGLLMHTAAKKNQFQSYLPGPV